MVPADILNYLWVGIIKLWDWVDSVWELVLAIYVPNADSVVVTSWQK